MPLGVRVPPSASIDRPTPPALAPPPGHPRFPLIDSLRAIAVVCVVLTHTSSLSHSNDGTWFGPYAARLDVGVTIFFLISGFLIYRPFVHSRLNGARETRVTTFWKRRFLRIFPAYWIALTLLAIAPGLPDVYTQRWWVYYGLFQAYDPSWFDKGIGPAWSLSTEVLFYVSLPLYAWAASRFLRRRVGLEVALLAGLGALSVAARGLVADADRHAAFGHASTFGITLGGTFLWFALGMGLAVVSAWLTGRDERPRWLSLVARRPWAPWMFAAGCFVLVSRGIGITGSGFQSLTVAQVVGEYALYGAVALGLLLPAVFADDAGGWPRRVLANRALALLGLISYGVFLWHLTFAIKLAGEGVDSFVPLTLLTLAVSVPVAAASYVAVERPLLRLKYRRAGRRPSRAASR